MLFYLTIRVGYRGDLDVKTNSTGKFSVFRRWKGFEIMFHVSTLLPFSSGEEQQVHEMWIIKVYYKNRFIERGELEMILE